MRSIPIAFLILVIIIANMSKVKAQTIPKELDQVELMKQFIGNWKGEFEDSTIFISENKPFASGMISNSQVITNGEIIESIAQLYGYDHETNTFIIAELKESSTVIEICSIWFTSENSGEIIITKPKDAPFRFKFEFKTSDMIVQAAIQDDKVVNEIVLERVENKK